MSIWPGSSLVEVVVEALEGRALAAQHAAEPGARRLPLDEEAQAHKQRQPDKAARGGAGWVVLYVRQSTLLLPSAPRAGGIRGASSAQTCVQWSLRVRCAPAWSPGAQGAQARWHGSLFRKRAAAQITGAALAPSRRREARGWAAQGVRPPGVCPGRPGRVRVALRGVRGAHAGARRRSQGACVGTCTPYAPGFSPSPGRSWNAGASASVAIAARAGPGGGARALLWCRARPRATRSSKEEEEKTRQTIWWAARAREARRRGPAPSGAPLAGPVGPGEGC